MTNRGDFEYGDQVEHASGTRGAVTSTADGVVTVAFTNERGTYVGKFDDYWFHLYPNNLKRVRARTSEWTTDENGALTRTKS